MSSWRVDAKVADERPTCFAINEIERNRVAICSLRSKGICPPGFYGWKGDNCYLCAQT